MLKIPRSYFVVDYVYKSIGYMAMKLILSREYFQASTLIYPALTMNKLILNYKKEEEKGELSFDFLHFP
jgi:hypothetical protein